MRWILGLLFFSHSALGGDPISKNVILSKVMDGTGHWERALILYAMEGVNKEGLEQIASRQKLVNPKFQSDLLYYVYTYDDQYEYKFYFNYVHSQCLYEVQSRTDTRLMRLCRSDVSNCRSKLGEDISKNDLISCAQKSSNCTKIGPSPVPETIDKKYCEKLYGRSL